MWTDDPVRDWDRHCAQQEVELEELPVCDICLQAITGDYYYEIGREIWCEHCMNDSRIYI